MVRDQELTNQVVAALTRKPSLDPPQIGIMVEDGVVMLPGQVRNDNEA